MWKLLISSLIGCVSIIGLYYDYQNRKKFKKDINSMIKIGSNEVFEGIISSHPNVIPKFESNDLSYPILLNNPIHQIDTMDKKYLVFHSYEPNVYYPLYPTHYRIRLSIEKYWTKYTNLFHISPDISFNNIVLIFKNNTKIYYTESKVHYVDHHKKIIEKYIPNNSMITIFGRKGRKSNKNELYYIVEIIGSRKKVLDDIAFRYYGISNIFTFLLYCFSISSLCFLFLNFCKIKIISNYFKLLFSKRLLSNL
jgi:hypothetical protein